MEFEEFNKKMKAEQELLMEKDTYSYLKKYPKHKFSEKILSTLIKDNRETIE